jgi:hypothetical protein
MTSRGRIDCADLDFVVALLNVDSDCVQVILTLGVLSRGYFDLILVPAAIAIVPFASSMVNLPPLASR